MLLMNVKNSVILKFCEFKSFALKPKKMYVIWSDENDFLLLLKLGEARAGSRKLRSPSEWDVLKYGYGDREENKKS
jgi:hypothetical protein